MDFGSNGVFIDVSCISHRHEAHLCMVRQRKGAVVTAPKTRAKTTTIIGAISPYGIVNVKIKLPKVTASLKKRKAANGSVQQMQSGKGGTLTGHYFNFLASTMDVMDRHEAFKGHYLIMDNAPIHENKDIQLYIESREYRCVYLPPYTPELIPIKQFWSLVKSKLKRVALSSEETLSNRIAEACNQVMISDL